MQSAPVGSRSNIHCVDIVGDRSIGAKWERNFCCLAAEYGFIFTPMQIGRIKSAQAYFIGENRKWNNLTLPDITIWNSPGMHHEIKHKNPTMSGAYGLEEYRFMALLDFKKIVQQDVYYTIHDHSLAGGKHIDTNKIEHWKTAEVGELQKNIYHSDWGNSWVNGEKKRVKRLYWKIHAFRPLANLFFMQRQYGCL